MMDVFFITVVGVSIRIAYRNGRGVENGFIIIIACVHSPARGFIFFYKAVEDLDH